MTDYSDQKAQIADRFERLLRAASLVAKLGWPEVPSLEDDLKRRWTDPAGFAAEHPEWFISRWQVEDLDGYDWDAVDENPWSCLQDCLGVQKLVIVVRSDATTSEIVSELESAALGPKGSLDWQKLAEGLGQSVPDFLHELSRRVAEESEFALVQLRDYFADDIVVACVRQEDVPSLKRLALEADSYGLGVIEL